MNRVALMRQLEPFKGKQVKDAIDGIMGVASQHGCSLPVNVMDPVFNSFAIDEEPNRLNVHTDRESRIMSFSIG